jgi:hypothetical protein
MSNIDDWAWKVIRACGLSTANADINVFALHKDIREMLKPRELTDEEIMEIYDRVELYNIDEEQMYLKPIEFAKELLKKASEK